MARRNAGPATVGSDRHWAAREALESLKRAEVVKKDPKLMADVRVLAKTEAAALAKVTGAPKVTRKRSAKRDFESGFAGG